MDNYLNLYPMRLCEFEEDKGLIVVNYYEQNPSFIEKIFFKKYLKIPFKIDLDEIGSFIYPLCDGKRTIAEIIEESKLKFGEKIEPAEDRVIKFMKQLHSKKLIQLFKKIEKN